MDFIFWVIATIVLIVLFISSCQDIKSREVYDVLSIGLLVFALGVRTLLSFSFGFWYFVSGILGMFLMFLLALLLYYTGQWGGADSKLLISMGALLGIDFLFDSLLGISIYNGFELFLFVFLLLFVGAFWSLLFSVYLMILNWSSFTSEFRSGFLEYKEISYFVLAGILVFFALGLLIDLSILLFSVLLFVGFVLLLFVGAVERSSFFLDRDISKLVEGDWLSESVYDGHTKIMNAKTLDSKDLKVLVSLQKRGKKNVVRIKEGIPFVPGFLFAYLLLLFGHKFFLWVGSVLFF